MYLKLIVVKPTPMIGFGASNRGHAGGIVMYVLPSDACADGVVGTQLGPWRVHFNRRKVTE